MTRAGVSGRVAELACVSVADQGLKRDVVARPGRRQCHVSVLGTADRRQAGRDERLERHHVRLALDAFRELDGLARAPALWAWESRTCPGAEMQIDSSAFEVDIAAHHAPRRLKLQRKLEELLHAPDRDAVGHRPGMVSARPRRARSRTNTHVRALPHARYWAYGPPEEVGAEWRAVLEDGSNAGSELTLASSENLSVNGHRQVSDRRCPPRMHTGSNQAPASPETPPRVMPYRGVCARGAAADPDPIGVTAAPVVKDRLGEIDLQDDLDICLPRLDSGRWAGAEPGVGYVVLGEHVLAR